MMASTRLICFSSTLSAAFCRPENAPTLGSMPMRLCSDPILRTCRNWSRKSSSEKPSPLRTLEASSLAFFLSICDSAFSISERISPMPRMRETMRSGWKGSSASYFSPMPMNLMGCPVTWRMDNADTRHAENARDDAVGVEGLKRIVFFADADELDGLPRDLADGDRRAAASVAVHLSKDDAGKRELLMKFVSRVDSVLSSHRIGDKQNFLRIEQALERLHLFHELVVDVETAGGIDDEHVAAGVDRFAARFFGKALDGRRIRFADLAFVKVGLDRRRNDFELLARSRAVDVDGDKQRTVSAILQPVGKLAGGSGFARALQPGHEHNGRRLRGEL